MSQKARNNAARLTAIGPRAGETSPVGALNGQVQRAPATQYPIAPTARKGTPCEKSGQADRRRGSASESQSVCCDAAQSYHVPRDRGSIAAAIIAGMRQAQQAAPLGRILPGQREEKETERLGAEQAGHHGDPAIRSYKRRWASRDFDRTN